MMNYLHVALLLIVAAILQRRIQSQSDHQDPAYCRAELLRPAEEWIEQLLDDAPMNPNQQSAWHLDADSILAQYWNATPPYDAAAVRHILEFVGGAQLEENEVNMRRFRCEWFDRFVHTVRRRPVRVYVLGGSVTKGVGCDDHAPKPAADRISVTTASTAATTSNARVGDGPRIAPTTVAAPPKKVPQPCSWVDYLSLLLNGLLGNGTVEVVNKAIRGADIGISREHLLKEMKAPTATVPDIVLISTQTNDQHWQVINKDYPKMVERLVRSMLVPHAMCMKQPPLIIFFEDCFGTSRHGCRAKFVGRQRVFTSEAQNLVADHYQLPVVSWGKFARNRWATDRQQFFDEPHHYETHPGAPVHFAMAVLLLKALVNTHARCCRESSVDNEMRSSESNVPLAVGGPIISIPDVPIFINKTLPLQYSVATPPKGKPLPKPKPILRHIDRYPEFTDQHHCAAACLFDWQAQQLGAEGKHHITVLGSEQWSYSGDHQKWGFRATAANATLRLLVQGSTSTAKKKLAVAVHYIRSYGAQWGTARVDVRPVQLNASSALTLMKGHQYAALFQLENLLYFENEDCLSMTLDAFDHGNRMASVEALSKTYCIADEAPMTDPAEPSIRYILLDFRMVGGSEFKVVGVSVC